MEQQWVEIFAEYDASRKPAKQFCDDNNIRPSRFYYWKRKLAHKQSEASGFIPIEVQPILEANLEFEYPSGVKIRIKGKVSKSLLRDLIYV